MSDATMERETKAKRLRKVVPRSASNSHTMSSTSSSSSSSSLDFVGDLQAALKRQRALGGVLPNLMPKRVVIPHRDASRPTEVETRADESVSPSLSHCNEEKGTSSSGASVTMGQDSIAVHPEGTGVTTCRVNDSVISSEPGIPGALQCRQPDARKKVHFSNFQGTDGRMTTGLDHISSHMASLDLTEIEWDRSSQVDTLPSVTDNEFKCGKILYTGLDAAAEPSVKSINVLQDELHDMKNFLVRPVTQISVSSSSCATTTLIHSASAPMINSTTHCSRLQHQCSSIIASGSAKGCEDNSLNKFEEHKEQVAVKTLREPNNSDSQRPMPPRGGEDGGQSSESKPIISTSSIEDKTTKEAIGGDHVDKTAVSVALPKVPLSESNSEHDIPERQAKASTGKAASSSRKRSYDPDLFFKVNGKLYQRLGKIGSGGSSEVHKVISSDCTIYALKKIKLKGRDYATAFGFCQEIEYLNKLKGKKNIIQLIDYEVTDKALLREVLNCRIDNKDAKVKDDGFIYMVLEYGEIDLAHMLSQKWKEMEGSNRSLDENWLRFYWQQILDAVNTIHEERIVHSDLKPANFLLVKGLLKLIDFGIAKAIMNDTTNIQRDSQMGTLSYMSPEAFLCNESDEKGNIIKCGRPSDIWSLGCILYQMVYGRTPFADYKTFWAKFKVITDPNHVISYDPVCNPWLLDLMQRCLAWDRNDRWRIPQLLEHPFIVPPIPVQPALSITETCELLGLLAKTCHKSQESSGICYELQEFIKNSSSGDHDPESRSHRKKSLLLKLRNSLANVYVE